MAVSSDHSYGNRYIVCTVLNNKHYFKTILFYVYYSMVLFDITKRLEAIRAQSCENIRLKAFSEVHFQYLKQLHQIEIETLLNYYV